MFNITAIQQAFQELADLVTPTMGAKGRLAVIDMDFDRPLLTDDGVTVVREARNFFKGEKKLAATSAIEAAATTEVEAYDGTTLTILLINELYKVGLSWTKPKESGGLGLHPQEAADLLKKLIKAVRSEILKEKFDATPDDVENIATISTKKPEVGKIVAEAYRLAGKDMQVLIEHDRDIDDHKIEFTPGMQLESGYYAEVMKSKCNFEGNKTKFGKAKLAFFSSNALTHSEIIGFLQSIPESDRGIPIVPVITRRFNPESLQMLVNALNNNHYSFQVIFLNEEYLDDIYLDLAAKTGGVIQDAVLSSEKYEYKHCGTVDGIIISQRKTTIEGGSGDVSDRIDTYTKEFQEEKYTMSMRRQMTLRRRISALTQGITKIKVATDTISEYNTLRLKLDDAIGAVKKSMTDGIVLGGGKTLYNLSYKEDFLLIQTVLQKPLLTILENAGLSLPEELKNSRPEVMAAYGVNVQTGELVDLYKEGIIDSFASIDSALKNALSIASEYLRAYTLILKK